MDDPIYRMQGGEKIKMLSLREGHEKVKKLRENILGMMETDKWNDYLKQQALELRKKQMFDFVKKIDDNKRSYDLNDDDIKELKTILCHRT